VRGGFGPRLALEAGFLIALAIAAGVAQLSATAIVVVMAAAWLLVCLFELALWAEEPRFPAVRHEHGDVDETTDPDVVPGPEPVATAAEARDGERA
jgi:hypothetical protein